MIDTCRETWAWAVSVCTTVAGLFADFDLMFWLGVMVALATLVDRLVSIYLKLRPRER